MKIVQSLFSTVTNKISLKQLARINLILVVFTSVAVFWLDRPIALFMNHNSFDWIKYQKIITENLPIFLIVFIIAVILFKSTMKFVNRLILATYFYTTLYITMEINTLLKTIFGRYWPTTWFNNNLSLIHDNVFGFDFWHGVGKMGSFPSGHTACVTFCIIWLIKLIHSKKKWFLWLWGLEPLSLIVLDYHFLGDCLAGLILGMNCAVLSIYAKRKIIGIKNE